MSALGELNRDEVFLKELKQIVLDNITNEQFGVVPLSQEIGMSRSHLYRKLQSLTGQSISNFIREIRMVEAMKLLSKDMGSVSEIAYQVGFNTPSYFHKCFHDYYGYPPGEVKKMNDKVKKKVPSILVRPKNRIISFITNRTMVVSIVAIMFIGLFILEHTSNSLKASNEIKSIAILPLKPFSKDKDQSYLAAGMHDAIIGELGKISGLRVISKTSTLPFSDNTEKTLPDIAKELGVQAIIEGSVFISGDSLRLQVQLIEVFPNERHLGSQEYYEQISEVLSLQSELVQNIAAEINVNLTPGEGELFNKKRRTDKETYKHYLRGMYYLNKDTKAGFNEGMGHLKKAIESDPADPFAYASLALGYAISGHGQNSKKHVMVRAKAAAQQALLLDENMAKAHTALGMVYLYNEWDWENAKKEFDIALKINPNEEFAHAHLAWLYLLSDEKESAIEQARLATEINPLYPTYQLWLGWMHQIIGNHEIAIKEMEKLLEFEPNFSFAHYIIGNVYYDQERYLEALNEYEKIGWKNDMILSSIGAANVHLGNKKKALAILNEMDSMSHVEFVNPTYLALLQLALKGKDSAMVYLNQAYQDRLYPLPWVKCIGPFNSMKTDASFVNLLKKMNLDL
ncbi:helix-turn-helix domain-containing protein [Arenibacter aquaticus]|uniref:Helix-turn-helix domain-containing protein n=1 Tax=Arenibacter aquaticus TaxID=2489054 RepID=A0A3S0AEH1_9FLAO|nr:helix-turn-helix domain-containing protein [Arenibacter aquaticus]RTE53750.1 helix-turn-helix domain-containing protein [Arenibacter aquaticus]